MHTIGILLCVQNMEASIFQRLLVYIGVAMCTRAVAMQYSRALLCCTLARKANQRHVLCVCQC